MRVEAMCSQCPWRLDLTCAWRHGHVARLPDTGEHQRADLGAAPHDRRRLSWRR